jgi:phage replication-related protein YjqB (UPF0714/DUF867 family)
MIHPPYAGFAELSARVPAGSFVISLRDCGSEVAVLAPHGGSIDPGTSEIALAIAGDDLSWYLFEGRKTAGVERLRLPSTRFDEPFGLALAESVRAVVVVQALRVSVDAVHVAGGDEPLAASVAKALAGAGFEARHAPAADLEDAPDEEAGARVPRRLCDRGRRPGIELQCGGILRRRLAVQAAARRSFAGAVRSALGVAGALGPDAAGLRDAR